MTVPSSSPSRPAPQVATPEVLARAEALYEQSRKRVSGRPPWAKLNPADPYDMGMRDEAIRQAEAGVSPDPVHDAEFEFLNTLDSGRLPPKLSSLYSDLDRYRAAEKARQRARKAGRAVFYGGVWLIKADGRAWLAAARSALALAQGAAPDGGEG